MEIKKIVFATDFSESSVNALRYAVDLAKQYGARLYFLHVLYDVAKTSGWYVPHVSMDEMYKDMEKSAREELEKLFVDEMRGYEDIERIVLKGTPHEEIVTYAEEQNIDLVVIGTHGRKGIDRMIFGSTAEQVIRNAPCPVLSVRLTRQLK
jgi:nucleotide-binding universal stress UspA family protein